MNDKGDGIVQEIYEVTNLSLSMDNLKKRIAEAKKKENNLYKKDIALYQNELHEVINIPSNNPNIQRMTLAKIFVNALKKEMKDGLIKAGVFGSTSRNEATEASDVDIVLFIKPLTSEERRQQNVHELVQGRGGICNFANNSYRIGELRRNFSKKTGIKIHCDMFYTIEHIDYIKKTLKPIMILE